MGAIAVPVGTTARWLGVTARAVGWMLAGEQVGGDQGEAEVCCSKRFPPFLLFLSLTSYRRHRRQNGRHLQPLRLELGPDGRQQEQRRLNIDSLRYSLCQVVVDVDNLNAKGRGRGGRGGRGGTSMGSG